MTKSMVLIRIWFRREESFDNLFRNSGAIKESQNGSSLKFSYNVRYFYKTDFNSMLKFFIFSSGLSKWTLLRPGARSGRVKCLGCPDNEQKYPEPRLSSWLTWYSQFLGWEAVWQNDPGGTQILIPAQFLDRTLTSNISLIFSDNCCFFSSRMR